MGNDDGELKVEPAVLASTCEAVSSAAEHLLAGLKSLDGEVGQVLSSWTGTAGGSYGEAWRQWHAGAQKVQSALTTIADGLAQAGRGFEANERAAAESLRSVYGG
jgi:WXG100 family type VII secretion target